MRPGPASEAEIARHLAELPGWEQNGTAIARVFHFRDFPTAVAFVGRLVAPAEALDHHPDVEIHYRRVVVRCTTHHLKGLTSLDFRLAADVDRAALASGADFAPPVGAL